MLAAFAALVAIDIVTLPAKWQLSVERHAPESVGIGDEAEGEYELQSHAGRTLRFSLYDQLPRGIERLGKGAAAGFRESPRRAREPLHRRGARARELGARRRSVARVEGALGLVRRTIRYAPEDTVRVTPSIDGRTALPAAGAAAPAAGCGSACDPPARRWHELREPSGVRGGDDPRRIDWKATARREKLITREYTVEQGQTVLVAVDAGRMMTQLAGPLSRFEHALSSATLLADVATQSGDQVGAIVFDDQVRAFVPAARGRPALQRLRDAFVPVRATMTEPDYAAAFRTLSARHRKRSLIVLYTDVIDPRASQSLIALTARGAMRHVLVVVALRNDALMAAAVPSRESTSDQLYESAAAEELVMAREEALARMRHAGVTVIDVSPRLMAAAVINRYLEIKARASL